MERSNHTPRLKEKLHGMIIIKQNLSVPSAMSANDVGDANLDW